MLNGDIDVLELTGDITHVLSLEGNLLPIGPKGDKGDPGFSPVVTTSKSGKTTTVKFETATGDVYAYIQDGADGEGKGDMLTEVYDQNKNGIVDNAEKVNNHTVEKDVPANAVFTDTVYDDTEVRGLINAKPDFSDIPTKVSDLTNDSGFIDNTVNNLTNYYLKTETYTKAEINSLIAQIPGFNVEVVQTLPVSDIDPHTIYLVPKTGSTGDIYDEYLYINNSWELIGSTAVDLTDYVKFTNYATNSKGGVIKTDTSTYGTAMYSGYLTGSTKTYAQYESSANALFVSKGTLENVITGKALTKDHLTNTSSQVDTNYKVNVLTTKNLFDIQTIVKGRLDNGVLGYASDTSVLTLNENNFSFTTTANYRGATSDYIKVSEGNYVFNSNTANSTYGFNCACYDSNKSFINNANVSVESGGTKRTFTITSEITYVRLYFYLSNAGTLTIDKPMLEKGNTATTYEPFIPNTINVNNEKYTDTINVGTSINDKNKVNILYSKNLFDKNNINKLNAYFESSGGTIIENEYNRVLYIPCTPNTDYAFTQGTSSLSSHVFQVATTNTKPEINTIVYDFTDKTNNSTFTYTTNATAKYLVIRIRGGDDVDTFYNGVQIEKGSTATAYEPYRVPSINVDGEEIYKQEKTEDFKNKITFNESLGDYNLFRKKGNLIMMNYQGANKTHTYNEVLFTLPVEYRPPITILVPFTAYGTVYGQLAIGTNGNCYINAISSESASGRICFTATYITD